MKKILLLLTLLFFFTLNILFVNPAEAKDHYLGVYEDGREAYVMTETIKYFEESNSFMKNQKRAWKFPSSLHFNTSTYLILMNQ